MRESERARYSKRDTQKEAAIERGSDRERERERENAIK